VGGHAGERLLIPQLNLKKVRLFLSVERKYKRYFRRFFCKFHNKNDPILLIVASHFCTSTELSDNSFWAINPRLKQSVQCLLYFLKRCVIQTAATIQYLYPCVVCETQIV